ncbi:IS66 family transposase [Vibrio rumoiensis]|uniref:IS66 family transposase n=1 Tax=Vibrio rumoiensis TaxID=76258 RepID=UPI0038CD214D
MSWSSDIGGDASYCSNIERACGFSSRKCQSLTNNEAERCIRGFVIQRKISFGTTSDAGDKFRSRIHTLIETCKNVACRQCQC